MLLFSTFLGGRESLPFGLNQRAYMLSEQREALSACEPPSTTLLPCQRAAQPIPLQYASPPVDLQKNAFHRATDKQNSRWVSLDFCSQGLASPTVARLQPWHRCEWRITFLMMCDHNAAVTQGRGQHVERRPFPFYFPNVAAFMKMNATPPLPHTHTH